MVDEDILQNLASLTGRQREILKKVCEGNDYKTIAKELVISEETVKSHVGNIYIKLGLDQMPVSLRKKALFETYCPALHETEFITIPDEPTEPETVSQIIRKIVEHDDLLILQMDKKPVIQIPPLPPDPKPKWGLIVILLVVIIMVILGGFKIYDWANGLLHPAISASSATLAQTYVIVTATPLPVKNTSVSLTTDTKIPSTTQFLPTSTATNLPATSTPTASMLLPYSADFSHGIDPAWNLAVGDWYIKDNSLTILPPTDSEIPWAFLSDPTLKNYRVKLTVSTPYMYSAAQGGFALIVRYDPSRQEQIGIISEAFRGTKITLFTNLSTLAKSDLTASIDFFETTIYIVEANGDNFTASVNGQPMGSINLSGFESGGIGLSLNCGYSDGCPSVSNLSIEPLP